MLPEFPSMKCRFIGLLAILLVSSAHLFSQKENPYEGTPDWYRPGHPLDPAESVGIQTLPGFKVEKVISIPKEVGSVTAMTLDSQGRIIIGTQHKQGLYRVTASAIGSGELSRIEPLGGQASLVGWAQGLLYAFDSLYVTVSDENDSWPTGLYRLLDVDKDGVFDQTVPLLQLDASGEHGPHSIVMGPEGKSLYMICGNKTPVPERIETKKVPATTGFDHLMPSGFKNTEFTDGGWVVKMDPDGSNLELFASGLRNSFDLAFNEVGDLFTFDSDMEFDLGTPFYRPTRICHIVSGGEFGWRANAGKWPDYYEDSVAPVVNIGPGSPTGLIFGYNTAFPKKYQKAMFALDWTYATIYAVYLEGKGASYKATFETFLSGTGLPMTDVLVGNEGALYVSVGGRKLGSAIYRIWYSGPDQDSLVDAYDPEVTWDPRELRLSLESYHSDCIGIPTNQQLAGEGIL
jgi:glucose/arabinose dehydrogenase